MALAHSEHPGGRVPAKFVRDPADQDTLRSKHGRPRTGSWATFGRRGLRAYRAVCGLTSLQVARRRTSQRVTAMSITDNPSSQPASIHWNVQNRVAGW
jgi:hypothetical protein